METPWEAVPLGLLLENRVLAKERRLPPVVAESQPTTGSDVGDPGEDHCLDDVIVDQRVVLGEQSRGGVEDRHPHYPPYRREPRSDPEDQPQSDGDHREHVGPLDPTGTVSY